MRTPNYCYFFGTFNPFHQGHLHIAHQALEQYGFERIIFVPAKSPPHKQVGRPIVDFHHRLTMVQLAIANFPHYQCSAIEDEFVDTPVYTSTVLKALEPKLLDKNTRIPFIIGADALAHLGSWHQADVLLRTLQFHVAPRNDMTLPQTIHHKGLEYPLKIHSIDMPPIATSSTQVATLIAEGHWDELSKHLPADVLAYIQVHKLYQPTTVYNELQTVG